MKLLLNSQNSHFFLPSINGETADKKDIKADCNENRFWQRASYRLFLSHCMRYFLCNMVKGEAASISNGTSILALDKNAYNTIEPETKKLRVVKIRPSFVAELVRLLV